MMWLPSNFYKRRISQHLLKKIYLILFGLGGAIPSDVHSILLVLNPRSFLVELWEPYGSQRIELRLAAYQANHLTLVLFLQPTLK